MFGLFKENEIKEQSKRLDALAAKIEEETAQCAALKAERDIADKEMNKLRLEKEKSSTSIEDKRVCFNHFKKENSLQL